jgi:hypothetical protein
MLNSTRSLIDTLTSLTPNLGALRVEASGANGICPDLIDVAVTDSRGRFMMRLDADYMSKLLARMELAIVSRIFDNGKLAPQAQRLVWQVVQDLAELQSSFATTGDPNITSAISAGSIMRGSSGKDCGMLAHAFGCQSLCVRKPRRRYDGLVTELVRVPENLNRRYQQPNKLVGNGSWRVASRRRAIIPLEPD